MAKSRPHLSKAPIAEAIVDFQVKPRAELRQEEIEAVAESLRPAYPDQALIRSGQVGIATDPAGGVTHLHREALNGRRLRSGHESVIQLRLDGLTYSKLPPYTRWEEISEEAISLWQQYVAATRPQAMSRIAVRYINDMILPRKRAADYLTRSPKPPVGLGDAPQEFLSRVVIWQEDRNLSAIVTQAMGAQLQPDTLRLLLDIDVFRQGELPLDPPECRKVLSAMRKLKNRIFFASLTEEAVEHFA